MSNALENKKQMTSSSCIFDVFSSSLNCLRSQSVCLQTRAREDNCKDLEDNSYEDEIIEMAANWKVSVEQVILILDEINNVNHDEHEDVPDEWSLFNDNYYTAEEDDEF